MLDVVYEDNHVVVVLKPQNVPSQEDSSGDLDMLNMVKEYVKEKYNKPGNVFIGLVHRLDRPTGGLMAFARTSKAASRLTEEIQSGDFEKTYFAITCGIPREKQGRLTHYLKKDEKNNIVEIVPKLEKGAKEASLLYKVLETYGDKYALVEVNLLTGRSHQIRVQMAAIGCPLFGDVKYNGRAAGKNLALWATKLEFLHPTTKDRLVFKSYPPEMEPWKSFKIEKYI